MSEKDRIELILQQEGISSGQFAAEIGIQSSTLSHLLNNRNKPSLEVIKKILNRYPEISSDWLIRGEGSMYRDSKKSQPLNLFDNVVVNTSFIEDNAVKSTTENIPSKLSNENEMLKIQDEAPQAHPEIKQSQPIYDFPIQDMHIKKNNRNVMKIILYYDDNTFQEFESK